MRTTPYTLPLVALLITPMLACGDVSNTGREYGEAAIMGSPIMSGGDPEISPGQLTAGRWNDHEDWGAWSKLVDESSSWYQELEPWGMRPLHRVEVKLEGPGGPAHDEIVQLQDEEGGVLWTARSDRQGRAYLFPTLAMQAVVPERQLFIKAGQMRTAVDMAETSSYAITLTEHSAPARVLDVMFMIDVTSSMLDEQDYLRAELEDVMTRLEARQEGVEIRLSMSFYCDPADDFSVKSAPFESIAQGLKRLEQGEGCGGGDYEEGVDEGLEEALRKDWSESARGRLLFLVLDAPPHQDDEGIERLQNFATQAASRGIRLVPIAASGTNKPLEFLLRSLVISTQGLYVFLTGHSGIGEDKIEPTIGEYEVEMLNELLLDVLNDYASAP